MQSATIHILIVDDEEGIRELLKLHLEGEGYVCHTAASGDAGLEVLATQRLDLALVDVMMPKMTGLTLFQHMKERHPDVAVVFITAVDDLKIAVENLKNGAYDYVVKPITGQRLQQVVKDTLEKRRAVLDEEHQHNLLEEQTVSQTAELEARAREVGALNRMVQAGLTEKFVAEEAAHGLGGAYRSGVMEGTVSIMFTDLEGSTEVLTRLGDEEAQKFLRAHNAIIRQQVAGHEGREVKALGDGFMIVFSGARQAVDCAVDIQRRLEDFNHQNADRQLRVRIGINTGEPIKEGEDFFGGAVVLAAKLTAQASGGQILVSDLLRRLAGDSSGLEYVDYGWKQLKGFAEKEHLYEVNWRTR